MSDCIRWTGVIDRSGYPRIGGNLVTRRLWTRQHGPLSRDIELDHLCRHTWCVNLDHLEPVTRAENMRRRYSTYVTCRNGHPYDAANTYIRRSGHRDCRACGRDRTRRYLQKIRVAA